MTRATLWTAWICAGLACRGAGKTSTPDARTAPAASPRHERDAAGGEDAAQPIVVATHRVGAGRIRAWGDTAVAVGALGALRLRVDARGRVEEAEVPPAHPSMTEHWQPHIAAFDGTIIELLGHSLTAFSVGDLTERWSYRLAEPGPDVPETHVAIWPVMRHGEALVIRRVETADSTDEILALRASDGAVAWRRPIQRGRAWGAAGLVLHAGEDGALRALDAATGAPRWRIRLPQPLLVAHPFRESVLAALADGSVVQIDRDTGAVTARTATDGRLYAVYAADDGALFLPSERASDPETTCSRLLAFDAARGALRWRSAETCTLRRAGYEAIATGADVVATCGADHEMRLYDRATGAMRGSFGTLGCVDLAVVGTAAPRVVAAATLPGDRAATVVALALDVFTAPAPRITVRGVVRAGDRVLAGHVVQVGGEVVRTDRAGRYRATVEARGTIYVEAPPPQGRFTHGEPVTPDGRSEYEVDLQSWPVGRERH